MFKKIKRFFRLKASLEDRVAKLEQTVNTMWEETHPPTMGGQ